MASARTARRMGHNGTVTMGAVISGQSTHVSAVSMSPGASQTLHSVGTVLVF